MLYAPLFPLLEEVAERVVLVIVQVAVDVQLRDVVQEIEVEVVGLAFLELLLEDLLDLTEIVHVVAGELGGEVE